MQVNVQLIDAESGNHLWADRFDKPVADRFDKPVADLFDMQDESSLASPTRSTRSSSLPRRGAPNAPRVRTRWISIFEE
jgi:hypothetical protein